MTAALTELLDAGARAWPDRVALGDVAEGRVITYRELDGLVSDLATQLSRHGVGRGDCVAIVSDNCLEYAPGLLAVIKARASAAPLDAKLAASVLSARLGELQAKAAIVPAHLYEELADRHTAATCPAWRLSLAPGRAELTGPRPSTGGPPPAGTSDQGRGADIDSALRMLTSGTTAKPKVVPLTHANLLASIDGIRAVYRLTPHDATLAVMPLFHGHGLIAALLATLVTGGACWLPSGGRFHAGRFWSDMAVAKATWYTAVPTIHQILLARTATDYPRDGYPDLRFVRSCSAALAPAVLNDLKAAWSAPVLPAYGMTETAHQACSNPLPSEGPVRAASVGPPTGVELRVTRPDGTVAGPDESGEVWVRGAAVTAGYLDNDAANADSFTDGWFHTGDLGHTDADGYLFLTGRIKEIINRGGEKISPAAVDEVLQSHPDVEDALTFAVPDHKYGEEIEAAVVLRPSHDATEDDLKQYARSRLSAFEVPKRIFFLNELPRTEKGAGDRRRLSTLLGTRK